MEPLQKAILKTLIYADLFDYPLTLDELYRFLVVGESPTLPDFKKLLSQITTNDSRINTNKKYFFLKGREDLVELRKKREKWSQEKIVIAKEIAQKLKFIPWIKMIGISGALAMNNVQENDDIDFIVLTARNRLWLTRGATVIFLLLLGKYRRGKKVKNMICPNIFLTEDNLAVPQNERNLYSAHEVAQVKMLWEKDNLYHKFLLSNNWVLKFLPNSQIHSKPRKQEMNFFKGDERGMGNFLELLAKKLQLWYMKKKRTIEKVSGKRAFFHPQDCTNLVLKEYKKKLVILDINETN